MRDRDIDQDLIGVDFDETDDFEVSKVALPFEMPAALDIKNFSESTKRSVAVEQLIQQNDDLMSRLTVTLRRASELEEQVQSFELTNSQLRSRYDNLKDQVLVLKRKIQILSERNQSEKQNAEAQSDAAGVQKLKYQLQLLEVRYGEMVEASFKKENKLASELAQTSKVAARLTRFRDRILRGVDNLREKYRVAAIESTRLAARLERSEATLEDLRNNFLDSTEYIKKQSQDHQIEVVAIAKRFEGDIADKNEMIEALTRHNQELQQKAFELDNAVARTAEIENQMILTERKFEDFRLQAATDQSDLQKSLGRHRNEARDLALELDATKAELNFAKLETSNFREENFKLTEQVENLQALWREQNVKVEKFASQNVALQKLNQELSMTINRYRKDLRELRERAEHDRIETQTTVKMQVEAHKAATADDSTNSNPELMDKINHALAGIQIS